MKIKQLVYPFKTTHFGKKKKLFKDVVGYNLINLHWYNLWINLQSSSLIK